MRILPILMSGLLLVGSSARAIGDGLPSEIPTEIKSRPMKGALSPENRTILGVTIGQSSLKQVKKKLGDAATVKASNVDGRPHVVCYQSTIDDTVVMFEAGPLGGFEQVTGVTVAKAGAFSPPIRDCAATSKITRHSATIGSLRLGGDVRDVVRHLKVQSQTNDRGQLELPFESTRPRKVAGSKSPAEVDTSSGIIARIVDQRVDWYHVYFTESM